MDTGHLLFAGLHFDRKRFGKDMAIFEGKRQQVRTVESGAVAVPSGRSEGPGSLPPDAENRGSGGAKEQESAADSSNLPSRKMDETERLALTRKKFRIHISTQRAPAPLADFEDLQHRFGCAPEIVAAIRALGLRDPTPIQRQAIPVLIQEQECFACAPTGSGKTLAYAIPILHALKTPSRDAIRALVLSPTRELAAQIVREFKKVAPACRLKVRLLTKAAARCNNLLGAPGCDILVSTPLRLASLLGPDSAKIDLSRVQHLVLDEADKLFEMGFVEQIDAVVAACSHRGLVRSLFSATLPDTVEQLARTIMHDPCRIVIGEKNSAAETVQQELLFVGSEEGRRLAMRQLLKDGLKPPVLVFVASKERAREVHRFLLGEGANVGVIHADRTQNQRDQVVDDFRAGKLWLLITTDLLGRGMDFKGVNLVVNYDFPPSTADYIHRVGRSGRAGREGRAITFYTEEDKDSLRGIANVMAASGSTVPEWMLQLPKMRKRRRHRREPSLAAASAEEQGLHEG